MMTPLQAKKLQRCNNVCQYYTQLWQKGNPFGRNMDKCTKNIQFFWLYSAFIIIYWLYNPGKKCQYW